MTFLPFLLVSEAEHAGPPLCMASPSHHNIRLSLLTSHRTEVPNLGLYPLSDLGIEFMGSVNLDRETSYVYLHWLQTEI